MLGLGTRPREATSVPEVHTDFVESLQAQINAARAQLRERENYLRTAKAARVNIDSLRLLADRTYEESRLIQGMDARLERIRQVLAAGCEPTSPPSSWFCGALTAPKKIKDRWGDRRTPTETWPCRYVSGERIMLFKAPIPVDAVNRLAATKQHFDDLRVYSPQASDFEPFVDPVPHDPVLIGRIDMMRRPYYFEIARWDVTGDLAQLFSSTV